MRTGNTVQFTKIHVRDEKLTRGKSVGELQFNSFLVHCPYPQIQGALWIDTWPGSHATANRLKMKPGKTIKHMPRDKICDSPFHDLSLSETPGMEWPHINITRADRSGQSVTRTTHFLPQIENLKRLPDHEDHITDICSLMLSLRCFH